VTSKICKGCGAEKDLADFYKNTEMADGHFNKCKVCVRARAQKYRREHLVQYAQYEKARANLPHRVEARRKYQEEHKEQISEYKKSWAAENEDSVSASRRKRYERNRNEVIARSKKWAESNPEKVRQAKTNNLRKRRAGGTPVVGTLPSRSSKNSASATATNVWLAAMPKPYWRLTMSCL
jgi:hypothetical protein